jgi:hypothetical protein
MILFLEDDFVSGSDLFITCLILQKQIEDIGVKKEKIVIPILTMNQFREHAENESKLFR